MSSFDDRIIRLERERDRTRFVAFGLVVVVVCGAAFRAEPEELDVRRLRVVDSEGKARIELRVEDDGRASLRVLNQEGSPAFLMTSEKEGGATLSGWGPLGGPSWILAASKPINGDPRDKYEGSLWLLGPGGIATNDVMLKQNVEGGSIVIRDPAGVVTFDSRLQPAARAPATAKTKTPSGLR